jgi:hypothetical protein
MLDNNTSYEYYRYFIEIYFKSLIFYHIWKKEIET